MNRRQGTRDLKELFNAAHELLRASMFYYWQGGYEDHKDQSWRESIDRMHAAFMRFGLPCNTYEEFRQDLEAMLESGKTPEEWAAARDR